MPPRWAVPTPKSVVRNPSTNSGASVGFSWVPGRIPTDEEDPQRSSIHRGLPYTKPAVFPPKVSVPIPPFPPQGSKPDEGELANGDLDGLRGVSAAPVRDTPVDSSQRDPSSDKMPKQEGSTARLVGPTRGILHPSKLPRKDLKYSEEQRILLDPQGCTVGCVHLTDITKSERGSTSGSGTAKRKEPNTPDLGSEGVSAPVQKQVKIKGATYRHGLAPSIHVEASLHDVPEREEDDNYEKDGKERDEEFEEDVNQGGTPKDKGNEEEEDDEDDAQFVNTNPTPPKCWTRNQQAHQDEQESSLVIEILSDEKKQQRSWVEAQTASKRSAPPSNSQPSSQGEGDDPVPEEADLQDPGNEDESVMKEVAKLNTKNKVQMKALSEAHDQCYAADKLSAQKVRGAIMGLSTVPSEAQIHKQDFFKLGPPGNHIVNDIHSHWESYFHKWGVMANVPYSQFPVKEGGMRFIPAAPWRNMSLCSLTPMARR